MRPVRKCAGAQMEFMRSAGEAYVFSMCLTAVLLAVLRLRLSQDRHPAARRDNVTCRLTTLTRTGDLPWPGQRNPIPLWRIPAARSGFRV